MNILSKAAEDKLKRFSSLPIDSIQIIADFDRTITQGTSGHLGATSYGIMERYLTPDSREESRQLYTKYRALEVTSQLLHLKTPLPGGKPVFICLSSHKYRLPIFKKK